MRMRALTPYLVVLLWAAHHTTADSPRPLMPWYKVRVSNARLEGNTIRTQKTRSRMQCAAVASLDPEAHLFCTPTPDTCTTYGVKVGANYDDPNPGPVTHCWTRHLSNCDVEGEFYLGGTCSDIISVCQQGLFQPYQGPLNTAQNFYYPPTNKCVFRNSTEMTWDAARANCVHHGGDLFVAVTMQGLEEYVPDMPFGSWFGLFWVGMKSRAWLDGRPVADEDWDFSQPDQDPQECRIINIGTLVTVFDNPCSWTFWFLCEMAVSPPP